MAGFDASGLDELIRDMTRLGQRTGAMAQAMTQEAGNEIAASWRREAEKRKFRKSGAMIESIGTPEGVQSFGDGGTVYVDVYPKGKDKKGTRNAAKAFIPHYGTKHIQPSYWTDAANDAAEPTVNEKLENMWGEFLEKGRVPVVADTGGQEKR